jgi:hypothetical protein
MNVELLIGRCTCLRVGKSDKSMLSSLLHEREIRLHIVEINVTRMPWALVTKRRHCKADMNLVEGASSERL